MRKACGLFSGVSIAVLLLSAGGGGTISQARMQKAPQITPATANSQNIKVDSSYGKMPLYFIPNQGQIDKQVAYYLQGKDKTIYFTPGGITFTLTKPAQKKEFLSRLNPVRSILDLPEERPKARNAGLKGPDAEPFYRAEGGPERWTVKLEFVGADKTVKPVGESETGAVVSYFKGKPEDWHAGLPTYSKIVYSQLWPGIDLVYYGTVDRLKYEFIVHPGADPSKIRLAYRGAESVSVDGEGRLNVTSPAGGFTDDVPVAYQEIDGRRIDIKLAYKMEGSPKQSNQVGMPDRVPLHYGAESGFSGTAKDGTIAELAKLDGAGGGFEKEERSYGFQVGEYDRSLPLILDPAILIYCGYIGGSSYDYGYGITVDSAGSAYVTGSTASTEATFPVTVGPDLTFNDTSGSYDAIVAKVNAAGTALVYCGYIGGSSNDEGFGIAVDSAGSAYVTGSTASSEATFPVKTGPDVTHNGLRDAFVAKVNASGTALTYCGYIGGSADDYAFGISVDCAGNAYVTGDTWSSEATFPITVGPDLTYNGGNSDAFVAKIDASGTSLSYCGYFGGSGYDYGNGITVDSAGNAYVTGSTESTESTFPVTLGPDLTFNGGGIDAFVVKVNAAGTGLVYCGYIGGSLLDRGNGIAVDRSGNAYVTGATWSTESTFPVTVGPDLTYNGGLWDAFVAKVHTSGTAFLYCGYIGGDDKDEGGGIAVDASGNAYVTGYTASSTEPLYPFPVTVGPDLTYNGGIFDAFVAKIHAAGTALAYCGYIGGSDYDFGNGIAVDGSGNAYVTGHTDATETTFPVIVGPDLTQNGLFYNDAFVAKVYYFDERIPKHAVGDLDGDTTDEAAVDFGANGAWIWDSGGWTVLSALNPESMLATDVNGDGVEEIFLNFGPSGLWLVVGGAGYGISSRNAEVMTAGDVDGDNAAEVVCDFGADGLWLFDGGAWSQLSGVNADYVTTANVDGTGGDEVIGDFGAVGLWIMKGGAWNQLSSVNADYVTAGQTAGPKYLVGDFGAVGLWMWSVGGGWTQLSGMNADFVMTGDIDADASDEIIGDFGSLGLWQWDSGAWTQLSGVNAVYMICADVNGDGKDEIATDFGSVGLWLWDNGAWSQLSGTIAEYLVAADLDGDSRDEILTDFGAWGLWLWNNGAWSQISANNPD